VLAAALAGAALVACAPRATNAPGTSAASTASLAAPARTSLTPLRSPSPAPPWSAADRAELRRRLDAVFGGAVFARGGAAAIVAADGSPLYDLHGRRPMTPASTLKLVVAATALDALGPQHRFATSFVARETPDAQGIVHGPLWFVGGGDPLFTSQDLRAGIGALHRLGLRRVDGPLLIDDGAFQGLERNPRWDPDDLDQGYAAATSAVSLDEDTVEFDVDPSSPGAPAHVKIEPPNAYVDVRGSILTGYSTDPRIDRVDLPQAKGKPYRNVFELSGTVAAGDGQKYWKPVLGMPAYVAGAILALAGERAIAFAAGSGVGPAPVAAQALWLHRSLPLSAIVTDMLVHSNNHTAEQLLRSVGEQHSNVGTDLTGVAAERRELERLGVRPDEVTAYDGSGLAPADKIAPLALVDLIAAELHGPNASVFVHALPRVGQEGTVIYHELNDARGRVRAKSGHLAEVNALAGIVATRHHGRIAFAFIVNDPAAQAAEVSVAQDSALDALADF
jgi:D-alanyl-D-alanine carboxypeptidase/D-alanyl-D-alanine-endopeptidase (penicillin-binding protein 4)